MLLAVVVMTATAVTARAGFVYPDFSNVSGLKLNGTAVRSGADLQLTAASGFQNGSAFTTASTPLGNLNSFSTHFRFRITNSGGIGDEDGPGADGLVFVIQTISNNVGGAGGYLGYGGINHSLGIEFDTFNNGAGFGDPNGNHVGIDLNGNIVSVKTAEERTRFNNGSVWNAWVDYNGLTDGLEVRWSLGSTRPINAQLTATEDLRSILGSNSAFLGFTAGTGSGYGTQDILSWEYRDSFNPIGSDPSAVPEPSTAALAFAGLLTLGVVRRRRAARNRPEAAS